MIVIGRLALGLVECTICRTIVEYVECVRKAMS